MTPKALEQVRAEALFISHVQSSDRPDAGLVRTTVMRTIRQHGPRGCAELVALEYGEHPDIAVSRMCWVLSLVRSTY